MFNYIIIDTPKVYGLFHIGCILVLIAVCVLLCKFIKKPTDKTINIVLLTMGIVMLGLEVYKELTFILELNEETGKYEYAWYAFPFQFCSTTMYVMVITALLKPGKVKDAMLAFLASYSIFGGLTVYAYPEQVFVSRLGIDIQSMAHHGLQIACGVWLLYTKTVKVNIKTILSGTYVFLVLLAMALVMNIVVYKSGVIADHTFNMFYVGPYYECTLPLVSLLWPKEFTIFKYILFLLIYIFGFIGAASVILLIAYGIERLCIKILKSINREPEKSF